MNSQLPQDDDSALLSSFDDTMKRLRDGDPDASRQVFNRYVGRLLALARTRMGPRFQSKEDPEDVVQSVFRSFFQRYGAGTLELRDWENLWSMLAFITDRKCRSRRRHYGAECRDVTREIPAATDSQGGGERELPSAGPRPEEEAALQETLVDLLNSFADPKHQQIIQLTLEGLTAEQISERIPCTKRMVYRTLDRSREWLLQHGKDENS